MLKKFGQTKKGFTLVELLAVITILGVIGLIIVPIVDNAVNRANTTTMQLQEDLLELSGEDYFLSNRSLLPKTYSEENIVYLSTLIEKGYIDQIYDFKEELCDPDESYVSAINRDVGNYVYTAYLKCDNYATVTNWGEWSAWQSTPISAEYNTQVQATDFYGYRTEDLTDEWVNTTDWAYDQSGLQRVAEGDTRTIYRYRDVPAKWYSRDYNATYYSTAPSGYPNKDADDYTYTSWSIWGTSNPANYDYREEQSDLGRTYAEKKIASYTLDCRGHSAGGYCYWSVTSDWLYACPDRMGDDCFGEPMTEIIRQDYSTNYYHKYWTGDNPSGPLMWYSNSGWAQHWPESSPPTPTSGYTRYVYTYLGTATVYRYRDQKWKWYSKEYYQDGGVDGYSITEPSGYSYRDDTQVQEVSWIDEESSDVILVEPTTYIYREIESRIQTHSYSVIYGEYPTEFYPASDDTTPETANDDFLTMTGMTIDSVDTSDDYDLVSQKMYRFRTRE